MKYIIALATTGCVVASAVFAGTPGPAPQVNNVVVAPIAAAAATDWSGLYVGGLVGFDSGTTTAHTISTNTDFAPDTLANATNYGAFVGYNKQFGSFVVGGEAAYSTGTYAGTAFPASTWDYMADLKARGGYSFGRAMVYGVVGYSFSSLADGVSDYDASGLNYGAGVDFLVTDRIFIGAEYLVRDLQGVNTTNPGSDLRLDGVIQSAAIRIGINF